MNPNPRMRRIGGVVLLLLVALVPVAALGQEADRRPPGRETLLDAARELMEAAHFCTLVTLDASGGPQARAMEPDDILTMRQAQPAALAAAGRFILIETEEHIQDD